MASLFSNVHSVPELFKEAVSIRIGSGIAGAWGSFDELVQENLKLECAGTVAHSQTTPIQASSIFDLASLTKILATTALYMKWHEEGKIRFDQVFPGQSFSFGQLLTHSSGLPAWKPFYESMVQQFGGREALLNSSHEERKKYFYDLVHQVPLESAPGSKILYSDLGFLYLSEFAEKLAQMDFSEIVQKEVWSKISQSGLHFRPLSSKTSANPSEVVYTEDCPWRGMLCGEVHDDNCWSMGGVSGHAGVFGSLNDVIAWSKALVSGDWVSPSTLKIFSRITTDSHSQRRAYGFDVPSQDGTGSTGTVFSPTATIGHLGFTGTSLWLDFDEGRFATLLTNRVHPKRDEPRIKELRQAFHRVAFK